MTQISILVVESEIELNQWLVETLQEAGYESSGVTLLSEARKYLGIYQPSLILLDAQLSDGKGTELLAEVNHLPPVVLLLAQGSTRETIKTTKVGIREYLVKPIDLEQLELTVQRILGSVTLHKDFSFHQPLVPLPCKTIVGYSEAIQKVKDLIRKIAPTNMSVLIHGESGVGKELVAAEIHYQSQRSHCNYVAVDSCSLQEKLFESELFGHERGAFTGAERLKKGLIEGADGGTLFLDEIGEIEAPIQAKLLRVLETGHFRRLGGTKDLSADVRIVAASNCNLEQLSQEGKFRLDLYYRLSGFVITIPALRERREDIPLLVEHFLRHHRFSPCIHKTMSPTALKELIAYDWPGNIRELKNVVERAIILSGDKTIITPEQLTFSTTYRKNGHVKLCFDHEPTIGEIEQHYLKILLQKYSGHRLRVAEALGISERNTYRLLKKYGLSELREVQEVA